MALNINGTTGISGVDASVSAPAVTGTDSNTGISFPSADTIKFSTGGVERMSITNSGVTGTGVGGKVVGFGLATSTTVDQYGNKDTYTLVGPQLTYTGSSASNKLLLLHNHHMLIEDASFWFMALFRDGTGGTKVHEKRWYSQDSQWIGHTGINQVLLDIPDTSSHTYQFAIYRTSNTNRLNYNYNNGQTVASENFTQIIALEIEP